MEKFTRRAFGVGAAAALTMSSAVAAPPVEDEAPPGVEFDGRPHQNPKSIGGGKITVTGVSRAPAGCKIDKVVVCPRKEGAEKGAHTIVDATLDLTKSPATWSARFERVETGVYWIDARVEFLTPDRVRKVIDSLERRQVLVKTE